MTCTEWCRTMYDKAIDEGRTEDAKAYEQLFLMWYEREQAAKNKD